MNQKNARKLRKIAQKSLFNMRDPEINRTIKYEDMALWSQKVARNIVKNRFKALAAHQKSEFLTNPPQVF